MRDEHEQWKRRFVRPVFSHRCAASSRTNPACECRENTRRFERQRLLRCRRAVGHAGTDHQLRPSWQFCCSGRKQRLVSAIARPAFHAATAAPMAARCARRCRHPHRGGLHATWHDPRTNNQALPHLAQTEARAGGRSFLRQANTESRTVSTSVSASQRARLHAATAPLETMLIEFSISGCNSSGGTCTSRSSCGRSIFTEGAAPF